MDEAHENWCAHLNFRTAHYSSALVAALCRKWRRVSLEKQPAIEAYERLTKAAGPQQVALWKAAAEAADSLRDEKVEAMDIYDIHSKPCKLSADSYPASQMLNL